MVWTGWKQSAVLVQGSIRRLVSDGAANIINYLGGYGLVFDDAPNARIVKWDSAA